MKSSEIVAEIDILLDEFKHLFEQLHAISADYNTSHHLQLAADYLDILTLYLARVKECGNWRDEIDEGVDLDARE